jgi:ABC-type Fe3+ transport system permease subunit
MQHRQWVLMGHSVLLCLFVTFLATIARCAFRRSCSKTDLPFRRALTVLLTVPLLLPPYVLAVAWFGVLGSGWLISAFAPDASSPCQRLFGLYGCTGVPFTAFVPSLSCSRSLTSAPRIPGWRKLAGWWDGGQWSFGTSRCP